MPPVKVYVDAPAVGGCAPQGHNLAASLFLRPLFPAHLHQITRDGNGSGGAFLCGAWFYNWSLSLVVWQVPGMTFTTL